MLHLNKYTNGSELSSIPAYQIAVDPAKQSRESSAARAALEREDIHCNEPLQLRGIEAFLSDDDFDALKTSFGSKYAHLVKARSLIPNTHLALQCGISDQQIKQLLSDRTKELWSRICKAPDNKLYSCLEKVQKSVEKDILESTLAFSQDQQAFLAHLPQIKIIVRSSSNEDNEDCVNAGGNITIAGIASEEELKQSIASVVASYFSYKSIKNRFHTSGVLEKMPLCSVLLMEQIVEESEQDSLSSGVMITHKNAWGPLSEGRMMSICATWGFGEGVVLGKVPSDEWLVTDNLTYKAIRKKPFRLISSPSGTQEVANPYHRHASASLSDEQLAILQEMGKRIEEGFGKPMDIEFVVKNNKLYIVQVRPARFSALSEPNYLDLAIIPPTATVFSGHVFLAGSGQVLSLKDENICFAETLDEADEIFDDSQHQAVVICNKPLSRNTHAEVNFSSKESPVPCLILSKKKWSTFKRLADNNSQTICLQTGKIVITEECLPVRQGLLIHPAHFSFSVTPVNKGIHGTRHHPLVEELKRQLTATPEMIKFQLDDINNNLHTLFTEILVRKGLTNSTTEVAEKVRDVAFDVFAEMEACGSKNQMVPLALHASMLRHLLDQNEPTTVGSHSIAGIEAETFVPDNLQHFMEEHKGLDHLCQLALLGKKAFELDVQDSWLSFIHTNKTRPQEHWKSLQEYLNGLDELNLLSTWFALHFKQEQLDFDQIINIDNHSLEKLAVCRHFVQKLDQLLNQVQKVTAEKDLEQSFENLLSISNELLTIAANLTDVHNTPLEQMQFSKVLIDLINLWDMNTKVVRTSKAYSSEEEARVFRMRVDQFADFGIELAKHGLIKTPFIGELQKLLKLIKINPREKTVAPHSSFNVAQWIIPQGHGSPGKIRSNDERLTIVHQNLLQASFPPSSETEGLLPNALSNALSIFKPVNFQIYAKRYSHENGCFVVLSDEVAKVKINVPINLHSFVIEMTQKRGSENIEASCFWRASDNARTHYVDGLKAVCAMTGLTLKSFHVIGSDLKADFICQNEKDLVWLREAVNLTISDVIGSYDFFQSVAHSLSVVETISMNEAKHKIVSFLTQQYLKDGTLSLISERQLKEHFKKHPLPQEVIEKVIQSLKTKKNGINWIRSAENKLLDCVLSALPQDKRSALIWDDLHGNQLIDPIFIEDFQCGELINRLILENPLKASCYYNVYSSYSCLDTYFGDPASLLTNFIKDGTYLSFKRVEKKHLKTLHDEDLKKIILKDFQHNRHISLKYYPRRGVSILRELIKENRSLLINYLANCDLLFPPCRLEEFIEEFDITKEEVDQAKGNSF